MLETSQFDGKPLLNNIAQPGTIAMSQQVLAQAPQQHNHSRNHNSSRSSSHLRSSSCNKVQLGALEVALTSLVHRLMATMAVILCHLDRNGGMLLTAMRLWHGLQAILSVVSQVYTTCVLLWMSYILMNRLLFP